MHTAAAKFSVTPNEYACASSSANRTLPRLHVSWSSWNTFPSLVVCSLACSNLTRIKIVLKIELLLQIYIYQWPLKDNCSECEESLRVMTLTNRKLSPASARPFLDPVHGYVKGLRSVSKLGAVN